MLPSVLGKWFATHQFTVAWFSAIHETKSEIRPVQEKHSLAGQQSIYSLILGNVYTV